MPQIAQQDYIHLNIVDTTLGDTATIAALFWEEFGRLFKAGTLFDVILKDENGSEAKIVGCTVADGELVDISYVYGGEVFLAQPE